MIAGVDGCPGGWLVVAESRDGALSAQIFDSFEKLVAAFPARALFGVDIPIGLPDKGARACEREARQRLGHPRNASVFSAPLRPCLKASSYEEACEIRFRIEGKRMSRQAYGILPKIREVDLALKSHPEWVSQVVEVHPEVSFALMNGGVAITVSKKKLAGREARSKLLERRWPGSVAQLREKLPRGRYAMDDLLDAMAALWTVKRYVRDEADALGDRSARDRRGASMLIWA